MNKLKDSLEFLKTLSDEEIKRQFEESFNKFKDVEYKEIFEMNEIKTNNNELIKIEIKNGQQLTSGRGLHKFLEVGTRYNDWISRIIEKYNFIENKDFITITQKRVTAQGNEIEFIDHFMTITTAKEISMVSNTEKGKEARQYFIKCEEAWNSPEMVLSRALDIQKRMIEQKEEEIKNLNIKIQEYTPKVEFHDAVTKSDDWLDMSEVCKTLKTPFGRNRLFEFLRKEGILDDENRPYQSYVDRSYFKLVETSFTTNGKIKINLKTVVSQKGLDWLLKILKKKGVI